MTRLEPQLLDDGVGLGKQRAQARVLGVLRQAQVLGVIVLPQRRHARGGLAARAARLAACTHTPRELLRCASYAGHNYVRQALRPCA